MSLGNVLDVSCRCNTGVVALGRTAREEGRRRGSWVALNIQGDRWSCVCQEQAD